MEIGAFVISEELFYCLAPVTLTIMATAFLLALRRRIARARQQMLKISERQEGLNRKTNRGKPQNQELENLTRKNEKLRQEIIGTKKFIIFNYCVVLASVSFSLFSILRFYEAARLSELHVSLFVAALLFFLGSVLLLFVEIKNVYNAVRRA